MEVKKSYLPQLHNGEHVAYHSESIEQLKQRRNCFASWTC
jgi:hypothetical protein